VFPLEEVVVGADDFGAALMRGAADASSRREIIRDAMVLKIYS